MKLLLTLTLVLITITLRGQDIQVKDSINVRILNKGRYYIKTHIITVEGEDYQFSDIWKRKHSEYQQIPYLWPSNKSETTVIIKRMIKYDIWLKTVIWPIDHVGESKLVSGNYRIEVRTKKKGNHLEVETELIKE
ncbi:MAG: hypothetical protein RLO12_09630 [Fulvivirga sp.]